MIFKLRNLPIQLPYLDSYLSVSKCSALRLFFRSSRCGRRGLWLHGQPFSVLCLQLLHQRLRQNIDPKEVTRNLHPKQIKQRKISAICSMIPTTKIVKLPRFLPLSGCTRSTGDSCSSMCAKSSDQRPPDTPDRERSASSESRSARWRGS